MPALDADARARLSARTDQGLSWVLLLVGVFVGGVTILQMFLTARSGAYLIGDMKSGIWMSIANDLHLGTFYRPMVSDFGYGGTRYMWLQPVLVAVLSKVGLSVLAAEFVLTIATNVGLLAVIYRVLRGAGVRPMNALPAAGLLGAVVPFQYVLLTFSSDTLAIVLGLLGFTLALEGRRDGKHRTLFLGMVLLASTFLAKQTSIMFGGAFGIWLLAQKDYPRAFRLAGLAIATFGLGLAITALGGLWLNEGPMSMVVFKKSANVAHGRPAPLTARLGLSVARVAKELYTEPMLIIATLVAIWRALWRETRDVYLLLFAVVVVTLIAIYVAPGTAFNHVVESAAVGLVLVGLELERRGWKVLKVALIAGGLYIGVPVATTFLGRPPWSSDSWATADALVAKIRTLPDDGPILSEQPIIPIMAGQRAFLGDPMSLSELKRLVPEIEHGFHQRLRGRHFKAVVLNWDPIERLDWYEKEAIGRGFVCDLLSHYKQDESFGSLTLWVPDPAATPAKICETAPTPAEQIP